VNPVTYSILLNGLPTNSINASRGLRQGDPLSPYLFLLCIEGLDALIKEAATQKCLHGIKVCHAAPSITHLFFAVDSLLFARANLPEAQRVLNILNSYEAASGQVVNVDKSEVSYSRNVSDNTKHMLQQSLGFSCTGIESQVLSQRLLLGGTVRPSTKLHMVQYSKRKGGS